MSENFFDKKLDVDFEDPNIHVLPNTLDRITAAYFSEYDWGAWKPPESRRTWVKEWVGSGEYLDIGCGLYPVTMDAKDGPKQGIGMDIIPAAAKTYKNYFKEFYLANIENWEKEMAPELLSRFNSVILSETLEHFHNPGAILKKAGWFLKPGGKILVTYPNAYSIAQRIDYLGHGGNWKRFEDFHRSHIYLVRKRELEKLFKDCGFQIAHFDFRPSDIIEGFPKEKNKIWRNAAKLFPSFLGHQFFYVLEKL